MKTLTTVKELNLESETLEVVGAIIIDAYLEGALDALKLSKAEIKHKVAEAMREINFNLSLPNG